MVMSRGPGQESIIFSPALASNSEHFYFSPNSILNFRKVTTFGVNWLKNKKVQAKKAKNELGVENTSPPPSASAYRVNDVQVIPLLHVNSNRDSIRLSMEKHLIDKAGTLQNGINRTCDP